MEAIIISIDAIVDVDAVHVHSLALDDAEAVIRAIEQIDIADNETFAAISEEMVGPTVAAEAAGRLGAAHRGMKLKALAVNRAGPFEGDVLCVDSEEEGPVSIDQRGIATQGNRVDCVVLFSIGAP